MKNNASGSVVSLQLCPGYRKPMVIVDEADLVENLGLKNDVHALPDSSRQILLLEQETLSILDLLPGQVKENITTTGISLMTLHRGDRLRIGNTAVVEITQACSPCSRMEEIRPGLVKTISGKRGMLAKVISGGIIRRGDTITRISQ